MHKFWRNTMLLSLLSVGSISLVSYLVFREGGLKQTYDKRILKLKDNTFSKDQADAGDLELENIEEIQDKADINIYYTKWGVQTFYNLLRLSLLAKTEVQFLYSSEIHQQSKINLEELNDFLKNKKSNNLSKSEQENESQYQKSQAIDLNKQKVDFFDFIERKVISNPNKKIQIWINSDSIKDDARVIKLLSHPNVIINGIEDSNVIAYHLLEFWLNKEKASLYDPTTNTWSNKDQKFYNRATQYILPSDLLQKYNIDRYRIFFSENHYVDLLKRTGLKNIFPFFKTETSKTIKDLIFTTRDKNKKRISTYWSKITSLNWELERDKVNADKKLNNRPSMIVLGTALNDDFDFFATLVKEYSEQYNIYYKGHPGHNVTSNRITSKISSHNKFSFFNYKTGLNEDFTLPIGSIASVLETQIPSEELTSDHATEENGLYFDKWALTDPLTSAAKAIFNGVNTPKDFIVLFEQDQRKIVTKENFSEKLDEYRQESLKTYIQNNVSFEVPENTENLDLWNQGLLITNPNTFIREISISRVSRVENTFDIVLNVKIQANGYTESFNDIHITKPIS
ncbi:hypothetical protein [Mycoplasma sp. Ms02]|uniref:hypothetical protein n=1 Tax=Mycoplasma sp. Ms02 TaxID=353851 RepID=UPI001C8A2769|nr:hypothetical protein [Mycoplasma sp. Ms02]QZE12462.1 hypothetical protein K4L35_00510 [Mycoplasma sp. Ms02]